MLVPNADNLSWSLNSHSGAQSGGSARDSYAMEQFNKEHDRYREFLVVGHGSDSGQDRQPKSTMNRLHTESLDGKDNAKKNKGRFSLLD